MGNRFTGPLPAWSRIRVIWAGVFDTDNPENPLADYTIVYLPTANGDVFLGDSVTTYDVPAMGGQPAGKIDILHKGYDNAASALDWMFKTYRDPKTVAVMGWSAGAIASPIYTHIVAQHYPDASVTHFADGGGAYRVGEKLAPLFKSWGTANVLKRVKGFEDLSMDGLSLEDLYIRAAELHPEIIFHQYNERHDDVQALFMRLMGVDAPDVPANLDDAHAYIRAKIPNFRTYTSWGHDEAIIGGYYDAVLAKNALDNRGRPHVLDRFYTRQTNGVRFLDWFTAAVTGKPVEDGRVRPPPRSPRGSARLPRPRPPEDRPSDARDRREGRARAGRSGRRRRSSRAGVERRHRQRLGERDLERIRRHSRPRRAW